MAASDDVDAVKAARFSGLIASKRLDLPKNVVKTDRTIEWFVDAFKTGSIKLNPRYYKREFNWFRGCSSRLVATALCARIIPPIVLRECYEPALRDEQGKPSVEKKRIVFEIVDGRHRIASLLAFALGPAAAASRGLPSQASTLCDLDEKEYDGWNGMKLVDLEQSDQDRFFEYALTTLCIPASLDSDLNLDLVYAVHGDINRGVRHLVPLERVLSDVATAPYQDMIDRLRDDEHFRAVYGARDQLKDMDEQLVMRALCFARESARDDYQPPGVPLMWVLASELNNWQRHAASEGYTGDDAYRWLSDCEKTFRDTMRVGREMFGDCAFKRWDATKSVWTLSPPFFELKYAVLSDLLRSEKVSAAEMTVQAAVALPLAMELAFRDKAHVLGQLKYSNRSAPAVRECKRALEALILGAIGGIVYTGSTTTTTGTTTTTRTYKYSLSASLVTRTIEYDDN